MDEPNSFGNPEFLKDLKSVNDPLSTTDPSQQATVFQKSSELSELADLAAQDAGEEFRLEQELAQACLATGATGAAIALVRGEEIVCHATSGPDAPDIGVRLDPRNGLSGSCIQTRRLQQCNDTETDFRVDPEASRTLGVRSIVVLPLIEGDKLFGIFEVLSSRPNAFRAARPGYVAGADRSHCPEQKSELGIDRGRVAQRACAFPAQSGRSGSEPFLRIGRGTPAPAGNAWKDGLAGSHAGLAGDRFSGVFGYVGGLASGLAERNPCASCQFAALPHWRQLQPRTSRSHFVGGKRGPAEFCGNGRVRAIAGRWFRNAAAQRWTDGVSGGPGHFPSAGFRSVADSELTERPHSPGSQPDSKTR